MITKVKSRIKRVQSAKHSRGQSKALKQHKTMEKVWSKMHRQAVKQLKRDPGETLISRIDQFREKQVENRQLVDILKHPSKTAPKGPLGAWMQNLRVYKNGKLNPLYIQVGPITNNDFLPLYTKPRKNHIEVIRRPKSAYCLKKRADEDIVKMFIKQNPEVKLPDNYAFSKQGIDLMIEGKSKVEEEFKAHKGKYYPGSVAENTQTLHTMQGTIFAID